MHASVSTIRRAAALILALALLLLCGCAGGGEEIRFDGFTVRTSKARPDTEDAAPAEESYVTRGGSPSRAERYVVNLNTKKFHYPWCKAAESISEKNRREFTDTRDDLIDLGYSPCAQCSP